jgi:hypothetical protein
MGRTTLAELLIGRLLEALAVVKVAPMGGRYSFQCLSRARPKAVPAQDVKRLIAVRAKLTGRVLPQTNVNIYNGLDLAY